MDILGKSNRFSYAAAWGAIAFLAADMVFGDVVIVDLQGPPYVTGMTSHTIVCIVYDTLALEPKTQFYYQKETAFGHTATNFDMEARHSDH